MKLFSLQRVDLPIVTLLSLCLCMVDSTWLIAQDDEVVEFRELVLDEPATSLTMTEDGQQLLLTHQAAHFVSVYDVMTKKVTTTVPCLSPRSIVCRGDEAFVANFGEGTISVLSRAKGWKKVNDLKLPKANIEHIAAARGEHFNRQLIVTCRATSGRDENVVYLVNIDQDSSQELGKTTLAEISADGRLIMLQSLNRDDGFGGLAAFSTQQFINPKGERQPVFRGGSGQTAYVYQVVPGSHWIAQCNVYGGVPIADLHHEAHAYIIPDRSQKQYYALTADLIKCVRLNTAFDEVGFKRARYPSRFTDFAMINQHINRMCDQPYAHIHGDRLHLFMITAQGAAVLAAETAVFRER